MGGFGKGKGRHHGGGGYGRHHGPPVHHGPGLGGLVANAIVGGAIAQANADRQAAQMATVRAQQQAAANRQAMMITQQSQARQQVANMQVANMQAAQAQAAQAQAAQAAAQAQAAQAAMVDPRKHTPPCCIAQSTPDASPRHVFIATAFERAGGRRNSCQHGDGDGAGPRWRGSRRPDAGVGRRPAVLRPTPGQRVRVPHPPSSLNHMPSPALSEEQNLTCVFPSPWATSTATRYPGMQLQVRIPAAAPPAAAASYQQPSPPPPAYQQQPPPAYQQQPPPPPAYQPAAAPAHLTAQGLYPFLQSLRLEAYAPHPHPVTCMLPLSPWSLPSLPPSPRTHILPLSPWSPPPSAPAPTRRTECPAVCRFYQAFAGLGATVAVDLRDLTIADFDRLGLTKIQKNRLTAALRG